MKQPAYKSLAGSLREEIHSGAFPPSRRLPTDAELGEKFRVSRQTVRQAFGELVTEGLVYRVPGRGSFAIGTPGDVKYLRSLGSVEDLMALAEDTELEVISPFTQAVDVAAAGRLRLPTDEVSRIAFRRHHDDVPFCLTTTYLPPHLGARIADDSRIGSVGARSRVTIIGLLEEMTDTPIAGAHQSISATVADAGEAELIGCKPNDVLLTIDRIYFDAQGRYVELAVSSFNISRYSYRLELRRSVR
jgi:GntR family transcriptional regulator